MTTMTITRALAELKLLDKRINKGIGEGTHFGVVNDANKNVGHKTQEVFLKESKANLDAVKDLLSLRNKIKSKIVLSNATTTVSVGGVTLTVAEAIEKKDSISYKKALLNTLSRQQSNSTTKLEQNNVQVQQGAINAANQVAGAEGAKTKDQNWTSIHDAYLESQQSRLVCDNGIASFITELDNEIDTFESEVDYVLSESNSTTNITV